MARASTYVKLGVFGLLALLGLVVVASALGIRGLRVETAEYHAFFDESVQGLELGAPVKYRGVRIGSVSAIALAPDNEHVDVTLAFELRDVRRLGLKTIPPAARAQLATQGITGVRLVDLDVGGPRTTPPPALPFVPPKNTIPTRPSTLKGLEAGLETSSERLPELIETTLATMEEARLVVSDFRTARIPDRVGAAVDGVRGAASELRGLLAHLERARLPDRTAVAIDTLSQVAANVNAMVERIGGDGGLLADTQRATETLGELGREGSGSVRDLDRTLRDLDDAARAIRDLAQAIERDPDMLVKGRAREHVR